MIISNIVHDPHKTLHQVNESGRKSRVFSSPIENTDQTALTLLSQARKLRATTAKIRNSGNIRSLTRITKSGSNNEIVGMI